LTLKDCIGELQSKMETMELQIQVLETEKIVLENYVCLLTNDIQILNIITERMKDALPAQLIGSVEAAKAYCPPKALPRRQPQRKK